MGGTCNNKKKELKQVKGLAKAHPYSRKAKQVQSIMLRKENLHKNLIKRQSAHELLIARLLTMQQIIGDESDINKVALNYIARNDNEIKLLNDIIRPNRPKPPRLALLQNLRLKDEAEFEAGMMIPEMTIKNLAVLKNWFLKTDIRNGDYNSMALISMIRVVRPCQSAVLVVDK
jgi:translation machinery-associated protein 16